MKTALGIIIYMFLLPPVSAATTLRVAVASNFTRPMEQISTAFTKDTGIEIQSIFASTGKLFAMIQNGAPFDVFLAADNTRPELLHKSALAEKPFIYAQGRPVLWITLSSLCGLQKWQQVATAPQLEQIAIANPQTAPYGLAASEIISSLPSSKEIISKLVYTQNAGQAFQYAAKITNAAFTAASFAFSTTGQKGCYWPMPEAENVIQKGCVLKGERNNSAAKAFTSFLIEPAARAIIYKFGYSQEQL